jgi:hypothetical protein
MKVGVPDQVDHQAEDGYPACLLERTKSLVRSSSADGCERVVFRGRALLLVAMELLHTSLTRPKRFNIVRRSITRSNYG